MRTNHWRDHNHRLWTSINWPAQDLCALQRHTHVFEREAAGNAGLVYAWISLRCRMDSVHWPNPWRHHWVGRNQWRLAQWLVAFRFLLRGFGGAILVDRVRNQSVPRVLWEIP